MDTVNRNGVYIQLIPGLLPVILSTVFMINHSFILLLLCVISLFVITATLPLCRKRESLYMFILVATAGLPVNIGLAYWLVTDGFFGSGFLISKILWCALLCCVFFSVEEIAFGVITRMIWKTQYKLKL